MANELFEAPLTAIPPLQGCYCFGSVTSPHKLGQESPLRQKEEQLGRAWAEASVCLLQHTVFPSCIKEWEKVNKADTSCFLNLIVTNTSKGP